MYLRKRIETLEAARSPAGPVIGFWAMKENCESMTDEEIEKEIAERRVNAPANARIIPMSWLPPTDP